MNTEFRSENLKGRNHLSPKRRWKEDMMDLDWIHVAWDREHDIFGFIWSRECLVQLSNYECFYFMELEFEWWEIDLGILGSNELFVPFSKYVFNLPNLICKLRRYRTSNYRYDCVRLEECDVVCFKVIYQQIFESLKNSLRKFGISGLWP
jgi:hypothetical protein